MIRYGKASSAASALLKLGYYNLYQWESFNFDFESIYGMERLSRFYLQKCVKLFEKSLDERKDEWNELIKREISSPGETHPILKTRLETFCVSEYNTEPKSSSAEYLKEYSKALLLVDNFVYRSRLADFEKQREELFLKPKNKIERWVSSGKPVYAHNYAEISHYLRLLGRVSEANELLNTAIQTFSEKEAAYAILLSGYRKLHDYDEAGIEYVYRAIGLNRMYASEGLEVIGKFCCLTGNQEEYKKCREKSVEILQKNKDIDKELKVLRKKDRITAERLPGQMGDNIVRLAVAAGGLRVRNIYVVRKTISEDLFTIAIIVRFAPQTGLHIQVSVLNRIRTYLGVFKDKQFSVFRYKSVAKAKIEKIESSCIYVSQ
jgi:tetratricopeptide (TPR) repeat protein